MRWFVRFQGLRHPRDMGAPEVEAFLSWLANRRGVSASTHRQALAALIQERLGHSHVDTTMMYTHVLNRGTGVLSPLVDALMPPAPSEPVRSS